MSQYQMVLTTVDSEELAGKISQALVENKLAACVQVIGPISSTYRWKGSVQVDSEWLCLIKTRQSLFADVERVIVEMHPYAWESAGYDARSFEQFCIDHALDVQPLSGQQDPFHEYGQVLMGADV